MAETYFPFDAGAGANVVESQWRKMAEHWRANGVIPGELNKLEGYADSTGMQVKVKTGKAWIKGHYYENDAEKILVIGSNATGSNRLDQIIIRVDFAANTVLGVILPGTTVVAALTQNTAIWEIPIATITVPNGAVTIAAGNVVDKRLWSVDYDAPPVVAVRRAAALSLVDNTATIVGWDVEDYDTDTMHDNATLNTRLTCKTPGKYFVWFTGYLFVSGGAGFVRGSLLKNGTQFALASTQGVATNSDGNLGLQIAREVTLAAGDYVEVTVLQKSGAAQSLGANLDLLGFGMRRVGI